MASFNGSGDPLPTSCYTPCRTKGAQEQKVSLLRCRTRYQQIIPDGALRFLYPEGGPAPRSTWSPKPEPSGRELLLSSAWILVLPQICNSHKDETQCDWHIIGPCKGGMLSNQAWIILLLLPPFLCVCDLSSMTLSPMPQLPPLLNRQGYSLSAPTSGKVH